MVDVRQVWRNPVFGAIGARVYDAVLDRPAIARRAGRAMWGCDTDLMYAAMDIVNEIPGGASVLDLPVGGGVTLRRLDPVQKVRYVAADISDDQLSAARRIAERHGVPGVEYVRADVVDLPFSDDEFDLVVTFAGLHCMPDPGAAIASLARVLRPGGTLAGSCVVAGVATRYDRQIQALATVGVFGPASTAEELQGWLADAGLRRDEFECNGSLAQFVAVKS
ncbi:class I SAM-dependent methyltransferase [Nocardia australiensis]|uniref:class I SAM-dependent methyltransferase n=1 Tax=Nocardia australiensis TaxID=2887191 RepID=UPI001D153EE4|nr:class I SAM-dependent methyltransferase [Nocardia australiensis]